ncbi:MAG TPA: UvrB/UvrC motif-containing protein [Fimbriimonadaceae bacterium]|nr:UvrB/UvrC motif-containing protein [Fimbriimonadaceae bacterium]
MSADLSRLLNEWPYEPGKLNVRLITGDDGEPRIQVRLDLGIIQMYTEGRPDGQKPYGYDSLLEYHEAKLDEIASGRESPLPEEAGEGETPKDGGSRFSLSPEECEELRSEAVQYYHRYMALLVLEDFEGVIRDTTRNLRVLDLCAQHAQTEADRAALEQFRPYITMMRANAMAKQALKDNEPKAALHAIDEGLDALRQYFAEQGEPQMFEESGEVEMLRGMREALVPKLPVSQKTELKLRLERAIEQENYELAAILRDELRMLKDQPD